MDQTYCVFLRGINVNGIKITMESLKNIFVGMGYPNVKTVLATGNAVFSVPENQDNRQELKQAVEKQLNMVFHYDAHVFLHSRQEITEICSAAESIPVPDEYHKYFILCNETEIIAQLEQLFTSVTHTEQERFLPSEYGAFWVVPKGSTLSSEFGSKVLGDKKFKSVITSRNMNTINKIQKAMN